MEFGIISEGTGYAIYNNASGIIEITSGSVSAKSTSGIYNNAEGTIKVIGGTVTGYTNGIVNAGKGTVTLGSTSDDLSTSSPAIIGQNSYGISSKNENSTFNFYNGVVKGKAKSSKNDTTIELGGTFHLRPSCGTITKVLGDLYATTLSKIVTVSFEPNGGTNSTSSKDVTFSSEYGLKYDSTKDPLPEPEKDGYIFEGWYLNDSNLIKDDTIVETEENHTLKANWKAITYIIEYDKNADGAMGTTENSTHTYDVAKNLTANGYEYEGYRFKGWNTNANGTGTAYTDKQSVKNLSKDQYDVVTLYAQWEPITYTVIYDGNGATSGSTESSEHVYDIEKALTKNGYSKTGYKFTGWNTNASGEGQHFEDEEKVKNLTVDETITLYAQWEPITYTIVYDGNGATSGTTASSSHTYDVTKNLTTNGYEKTGYIFKGWNTKKDGSGTSYENKASVKNLTTTDGATITLYAKWGAIEYTVVYNGNGSTGGSTTTSTHTYDIAKKLTKNGYTKTGYTFKAWNTKADGTGTSYSDEASVKNLASTDGAVVNLYAQWRAHTYTVVYDGNGATDGSTANSSHTYDVAKNLTANGYTKTGYLFKSWNTQANGKGTSYLDKATVKNLTAVDGATVTLYAQWTPITYTVTYNGNGSTGGSTANSTHTYDVAKNLTANGYTRTGYTFNNWTLNSSGTGTSYANKESVKNLTTVNGATVTLYAQWTINTSKLTINPNEGSVKVTSPTGGTAETIKETKTYTQNYNTTLTYETPTKESTTSTQKFTVTYNHNYSGSTNTSDTAVKTTTYTFAFSGWTKSDPFYGTLSNLTGSGTYTYPAENNVTSTIKAEYSTTSSSTTTSVKLPTPTRTGYTFDGWYRDADCINSVGAAGSSYTPTENITLYAKWIIHTSKLTINPNGGSVKITSPTGGTAETIKETKTYTQNYNTKLAYEKPTKSNDTETYTVTYNAKGGSVSPSSATATKTITYTFSSWTKSSTFYGTLSNTTGSGTYTYPAENNVTSTITASYSSSTSTTSVKLPTPTREGYTFSGWYSDDGYVNSVGNAGDSYMPTGNITLYAKWTINTSKLTINPDPKGKGTVVVTSPTGGTAETITASKTYTQNYNTTLIYATPTKSNDTEKYTVTYNANGGSVSTSSATATKTTTYSFKEWEKSDPFYGTLSNLTGSGTYTFPSNKGVTSTITAKYTSSSTTTSVKLPTPTRTGYTCLGWATSNTATSADYECNNEYTPSGNVTLYAIWSVNTSELKIELDGGSVTVTSPTGGTAEKISTTKTYTQNYNTTLTYGEPTKSNKTDKLTVTFNYNGSGASNTTATATKTTTYSFKEWEKSDPFYGTLSNLTGSGTYTFPSNKGVTSTIKAVYSDSSTTTSVTLPTPTRTGYTFGGWYKESSCTNKVEGTTYTPTENVTLYAKWDQEAGPTYTSYEVKNLSNSGYDVYVYGVSDPTGVDRAQFPTWTSYNDQDDLLASWNTSSAAAGADEGNETWHFRVNTTDHNGECGQYYTHIYLYDSLQNYTKIIVDSSKTIVPGITVTIKSSNTSYGTVSPTTVSVGYGAKYSSSGTKMTFPGGQTVTASAISEAGYTTSLSSWSPASGTITGATTVTANFVRTANRYTVTLNKGTGISSVTGEGTYSYGEKVTINATTSTGYSWSKWSGTYTSTTQNYSFAMPAQNVTLTANAKIDSYTITYATYNLVYGFGDVSSTKSGRMTYSIKDNVITVKADETDGYGFVPYRVDLEANKTYIFSLTTSGTYKTEAEAFWMLDGAYNTYYYMDSASGYKFTPTVSGTYYLRLDVNTAGNTCTFSNIRVAEIVKTATINHGSTYGDTMPTPTKTGYSFVGWFDDNYVNNPLNYYADAHSDLKNAFGYNEDNLYNHYVNYGKSEGRQISQYISTDTVTEAKTLYGYMKPGKYTITYNANGGTGAPSAQTKTHGVNITLSATEPTLSGHNFLGWSTSSSASNPTYAPGATYTENGNVTLYAVWSTNSYSVTLNKGTGIASVTGAGTYEYGATVTLDATLSTGYHWSKWSGTYEITTQKYTLTMPAQNVTLTANAAINTSTLKINPNGGSVVVTSPTGGTATTITSTKSYTQNYNTTLTIGTPTKANSTATTQYTVTYDATGGSVSPSSATATRTTITKFSGSWSEPTYGKLSNGVYTFPEDNGVTDTVTASYAGTVSSDTTTSVTLPTPTRTGYTFTGWYTAKSGGTKVGAGGDSYTPKANETLYAVWSVNASELKINPNGGSVKITSPTGGTAETITSTKTYTQNYNTTLTYATPTKANKTENYTVTYDANEGSVSPSFATATKTTTYTFSSWTKSSTFYGILSNLTGNGTYTFPADTGVSSTITASYSDSSTTTSITLPTPTKTGYTCLGWSTNKKATTAEYKCNNAYTPTADVTLYAVWTAGSFSVTLNKGTGIATVTGAGTYSYGSSVTVNATLNTGYHWSSWSGTSSSTNQSYTFTMPASNVTLTANGAINTSTLTINPDGGSVSVTSPTGGTATTITSTKSYTQNYNTTLTMGNSRNSNKK